MFIFILSGENKELAFCEDFMLLTVAVSSHNFSLPEGMQQCDGYGLLKRLLDSV